MGAGTRRRPASCRWWTRRPRRTIAQRVERGDRLRRRARLRPRARRAGAAGADLRPARRRSSRTCPRSCATIATSCSTSPRRNTGTTKPDGSFDVDGASGTLAYYCRVGREASATGTFLAEGDGVQLAKTEGFCGQHILVPRHGVAVHINAFNFPAWGFAEKAACALLAGMPVITKPATATALVTERVHRADRRGGHPARGRAAAHRRLDRRPARPARPAGRARLHRLGRHGARACATGRTSWPPTRGSTSRPTA